VSNSILTSIKKLCNLGEEYTPFDQDIIIHINTAFSVLNQLGAGPEGGYRIKDASNEWSEFIPEDCMLLEMVKDFIYIKCRLIFDPPASSSIAQVLKDEMKELESRILYVCDSKST